MVPAAYLCECFSYEPSTGLLAWKDRPVEHFTNEATRQAWRARSFGKPVGNMGSRGYHYLSLSHQRRRYKLTSHRVAWAVQFGEYPKQQIDHINHCRHDNRLANLRDVSQAVNMQNRKLRPASPQPATGVRQSKGGRFTAYIGGSGRQKHLGTFDTVEAASAARAAARSAA